MLRRTVGSAALIGLFGIPQADAALPPAGPRVEIRARAGLVEGVTDFDGRLFVVFGKAAQPEPWKEVGETGFDATPAFARDVHAVNEVQPGVIDAQAIGFPKRSPADLPAGRYVVQAVLRRNPDTKRLDGPGNLMSRPIAVEFDPRSTAPMRLELDTVVPPERMPNDTDRVRYVKLRSECLSRFHNRPIYVRAGVLLPRDFGSEPDRRYPLRVRIGDFAERFTSVARLATAGGEFLRAFDAEDLPRMLLVHLDGDGPYGDPYQVDSEVNGPYGEAVIRELLPQVEREFRGLGRGDSRVLDGGSTGGWVSLALQVFHPDEFAGAWGSCPDSVDFRSLELVNIYDDRNAYVNDHGFERPAARETSGEVKFTMRHECAMENLLGDGDSWANSGGQWGAWNAVFGPRGEDGRPIPLWDPRTGLLDRRLTDHWKGYDLRHVLERYWKTLGPKLRGKLHIQVGDADDYFLDNAVRRLDDFLQRADPPFEGTISYGPRKGHCWRGIDDQELIRRMDAAMRRARAE